MSIISTLGSEAKAAILNSGEYVFLHVVSLFKSITPQQWDQAKQFVLNLVPQLQGMTSAQKVAFVQQQSLSLLTELEPYVVQLLVNGAFGFLRARALA